MEEKKEIQGAQFMGENLRNQVKFIGEGVRLYPMCKIIRPGSAELDNHCQIMDFTFIDAGELLKIGKYSTITWHCLIEGGAKTYIGDRVFVGPGSKLLTSTYELDGFYSVEHLPEGCGAIRYGDIILEDDAYLGSNVTVLPGITIGCGAVVGASSLVNKDLEPWGIYVGIPCKKIGERRKPTIERQEKIKEVDWSNHL
jgi:acetyltransferase-like isoleucine patch superfamily enzyme